MKFSQLSPALALALEALEAAVSQMEALSQSAW